MRRKELFLVLSAVLLAVLAFPGKASATGTASGTTIQNIATVSWTSGASTQTDTSGPIDSTVATIGGDTLSDEANATFNVGETQVFTYTLTNTGNASDTFQIYISDTTLTGGASLWRFTLYVGNQSTSLMQDTLATPAVAADGTYSCSVAVWSNSNPDSSPDGAAGEFKLVILPGFTQAYDSTGQYTGDNGTTYATDGIGSSDTAKATIAAAILTLAKGVTAVTIGGNASVPLPGATIEYELTYNNTGSAAADSVIIYDSVPTNTTWDTASNSSTNLGATATFVEGDSGATGWELQVSTLASPNQAYNSPDYKVITSYGGAPSAVKWIRWVRQQVPAAETKTMRFRVIIQ
ncbi:MAG: hypothetical protein D6679_11360 [Candidatus Hydrogenedentota bacterium]|nr:MAG: hypothetical protein D6679_11360 [Candidatus Hydrogenedentota bacterium]